MTSESFTLMREIEAPTNPFPGLRPFEFDESHLFFGRDGQSEQLLRKLSATRFVAVVGTSGSGKSSLVRAGLLPDLFGGFLPSAGSKWRVGIMRPSNDPLGNLSRALASTEVFGSETVENAQLQANIIEATLRRGSLGLVEVVRQNRMPAHENLLVVVDQFEELFRFARASRDERYNYEAAGFVKLLLEAARQREFAIYVVLTMRSDFLGDCSLFWGLPEAVNEGQYLIPRLTRDQRSEAITGPIAVGGGAIAARLVNRLLNDMGDEPDQLPILQHALMRAWEHWKKDGEQSGRPIDLPDYEAIGGMAEALSRHADEAYNELRDERSRLVAERIFKGLTEKGADNREIRRPVVLRDLCALSESEPAEVMAIIELFRREGRTFLMPPAPVPLEDDSLIDISHESLIRNWQRLKEWVNEEALSAQIYRRLAETAELYERGQAGLWRDPDLQIALNWREQTRPNQVWANRYHKGFEAAMKFLDASVARRDAELLEAERRRKKELRRARLTAIVFAVAFLFSLAVLTYALVQRKFAVNALTTAEEQKNIALNALKLVDSARREAVEQKDIAKTEAVRAEEQSKLATAEKENAEKQKKIAEAEKVEAQHAKSRAEVQARIASEQRGIAEAEGRRAATELEKNRHLLYAADLNLAQQAYEANSIRRGLNLLDTNRPNAVNSVSTEVSNSGLAGFEYYYLWQLFHGESEQLFFDAAVNSVAFSPGGNVLAIGIDNGSVRLWDRERGRALLLTREEVVERVGVKTVAFSPDGKTLALAGGSGRVKLFSTASNGNPGVTLKVPEYLSGATVVALSNIAYSPDGRSLAIGISAAVKNSRSITHRVLVWDAETHELRAALEGPTSFINSVDFSPDGTRLVTASSDGSVRSWNVRADSYEQLSILSDERSPAQVTAFSHDGKVLAVGYLDGSVRLWNTAASTPTSLNQQLTTTEQQRSAVSSLSFTPDGRIVAAGRGDGTIQLWAKAPPSDSYQDLTIFKSHTRAVNSLDFSSDGNVLASGSKDESVRFWDTGPQIYKLLPLPGTSAISTMALSADGKTLAIGSVDSTVRLCGTDTIHKCTTWSRPGGAIKSMALSPEAGTVAIADKNNNVELWRVGPSNAEPLRLDAGTAMVSTMTFSPDGRRLATVSADKTVRVWDVASGVQVKQLHPELQLRVLTFSPDGEMLAGGGSRGGIAIWSLNSDAEPIMLRASGLVTCMAFSSPDARMFAVGALDRIDAINGTVRLWDMAELLSSTAKPGTAADQASRRELVTLESHAGAVNVVAFSPDGKTLATGGEDATVKLWSVTSYKELLTLKGHTKSVTSLVFAPDGKWLASGSYDNSVRFWYAATMEDYLNPPRRVSLDGGH
ncbi:MAG TPA: hypothetical protein VF553_09770 [Pyrinomonadaceae bacterium]|jgi:WD40 repeat protein